MVRKCRARPNPTLTTDEYYGILSTWLLAGPATTLHLKVGRNMTSDFRAVTGKSLTTLRGLIEALVNSSPSGAIHGTRLERALAKMLADYPQLLSEGQDPDKECVRFADHVLAHMYMVRHLASEHGTSWQGHRKYPKSGGLRKQLTTGDWCWLTPVLKQIMGTSAATDGELETGTDKTPTTTETSEPPQAEVEINDEGWPTIFSSILAGVDSQDSALGCELGTGSCASVQDDSQMPSLAKVSSVASFGSCQSGGSAAATEFYDEEGFPTCFGMFGPSSEPKLQTRHAISDEEVAPITPRPRKRKAEAKAMSSSRKAKAKASTMSSSRKKPKRLRPPAVSDSGARRGRPPKFDDGGKPLGDFKISGPTKGINPKTELCAMVDGARVHVLTLTKASWGPTFDVDLRHIAQLAEERGLNKAGIIALRDEMKVP
jgi:hypothetical protein